MTSHDHWADPSHYRAAEINRQGPCGPKSARRSVRPDRCRAKITSTTPDQLTPATSRGQIARFYRENAKFLRAAGRWPRSPRTSARAMRQRIRLKAGRLVSTASGRRLMLFDRRWAWWRGIRRTGCSACDNADQSDHRGLRTVVVVVVVVVVCCCCIRHVVTRTQSFDHISLSRIRSLYF